MSFFIDTLVYIEGNSKLRSPQIEAYIKIKNYFSKNPSGEALVVLPTGTGKSGLISIAPFGVSNKRVLIITPGLVTKQSIKKTQDALEDNFWINCDVIFNPEDIPIVSEYDSNISDEHLEDSHIIVSNIHRLGSSRKHGLLNRVKKDFFDLVIVDEAHHSPAESWGEVLDFFDRAKKLLITGTPYRGDNQEIRGELIHETPLSEVMRDKYVAWLRKETVNAHQLFFTMPEAPEKRLTKDEVLEYKDKEWIEKSIALSEDCSKNVIQHSLLKLKELKEASPKVPHKILAVGCSIMHAQDLHKWYEENGVKAVIVHSKMEDDNLKEAFLAVETHQCDAVISVNMLMEGYDHKYLTVLAIFRPYRSINAFAQVVGRVLRAIPEEEITSFEIDNNAIVVYHQETGLDSMWGQFQKEVERAKHKREDISLDSDADLEREYAERDKSLAGVESEKPFMTGQDSYLGDIDFNQIFADKKAEINANVASKIESARKTGTFDEEDLEVLKKHLVAKETKNATQEIDSSLLEKRPHQARQQLRELLTKKVQDEVANLLADYDDISKEKLYAKFSKLIYKLQANTPNDGILVRYINHKLSQKFGAIKDRSNDILLESLNFVPTLIEELRRILNETK